MAGSVAPNFSLRAKRPTTTTSSPEEDEDEYGILEWKTNAVRTPLARAHLCTLRVPSSSRDMAALALRAVASLEGALLPIMEIAGP